MLLAVYYFLNRGCVYVAYNVFAYIGAVYILEREVKCIYSILQIVLKLQCWHIVPLSVETCFRCYFEIILAYAGLSKYFPILSGNLCSAKRPFMLLIIDKLSI